MKLCTVICLSPNLCLCLPNFADIASFTNMCGKVSPAAVMAFLNDLFTLFDQVWVARFVYHTTCFDVMQQNDILSLLIPGPVVFTLPWKGRYPATGQAAKEHDIAPEPTQPAGVLAMARACFFCCTAY